VGLDSRLDVSVTDGVVAVASTVETAGTEPNGDAARTTRARGAVDEEVA
jgi:hypothetical protein